MLKTIEQIYKDIAEDDRIAPQVRLNAATQWRELLEARSVDYEVERLREALDAKEATLQREREDRDAYKMIAMRMNAPLIQRKREIEELRREVQAVRMAWGETTAELKQTRDIGRQALEDLQHTHDKCQFALEKEREDRRAAHAQLEVTERKLEHCRNLLKAARISTAAVCEMANARDTELAKNEAALIALIRRIEAEHAKGSDVSVLWRRHYGHRSVQVIGGTLSVMGDSLTQIALELEEVSDGK
jgi:chromosome segregation ATPase